MTGSADSSQLYEAAYRALLIVGASWPEDSRSISILPRSVPKVQF
jgi:hypothetical protein